VRIRRRFGHGIFIQPWGFFTPIVNNHINVEEVKVA
jgi:hypothetical protein